MLCLFEFAFLFRKDSGGVEKKKKKKQLHWFESQVSESNRVTSSSRVWALKFVFASEKAIWSVTMKTKIVNQIFIIVLAILASG
jgi:hypothetical protein